MDKPWLFIIQNHARGLCLKLCELIVRYEVSDITFFLNLFVIYVTVLQMAFSV